MSRPALYVLCGTRSAGRRSQLPFHGPVAAPDAAPIVGLPWGAGDPAVAGLDQAYWAVLRVDDADGGTALPGPAWAFRRGTVMFHGEPRGALEALLILGADHRAMTAQLALPDEWGVARAAAYGVAVAGRYAMAAVGAYGHALAEDWSTAIAGRQGHARLKGDRGLAVAGAGGSATARDDGMAVLRGIGGQAMAGACGIAATLRSAGSLQVGDDGCALALGRIRRASAGARGIIAVLDASGGRTRITLGPGGLAVLRQPLPAGTAPAFTVAVAGEGGFAPDRPAVFWRGAWHDPANLPTAALDEPAPEPALAEDEDPPPNPYTLPPAEAWPDDTIPVLCGWTPDHPHDGPIAVADWDPADPASGITGLAWGHGDGMAGGLGYAEAWMLVRVPRSALQEGAPGTVRFGRGDVLLQGSQRTCLAWLLARGADPKRLVGQFAIAGAGGLARAGTYGAAWAGPEGWAFAGHNAEAEAGRRGFAAVGSSSTARVGDGGIAMSDEMGWSIAGRGGIAISEGKRYGNALSGAGGLAIGDGRFKVLQAGPGGGALSTGGGGRISAGDDGVAIGRGDVEAGRDGIAITLDGTVSGGPNCLLVARWVPEGAATPRYVTALVGMDGVLPYTRYRLQGGALQPA